MKTLCYIAPVLMLATLAAAQDEAVVPAPIVTNTVSGTATALPTRVEFWLHWELEAESLEAAMAHALTLKEEVVAWMADNELRARETEFTAPAVGKSGDFVRISARLSFPMTGFANAENGPLLFARLCDAVKAGGGQLGATTEGPELIAGDRDRLVDAAVKKATENAYAAAAAVADSLKSIVDSVDAVEILEIDWNRNLRDKAVRPNLREVTCTAKVKVVYLLSPQS